METKRLNIQVTPETYDRYHSLKDSIGGSHAQVFETLLDQAASAGQTQGPFDLASVYTWLGQSLGVDARATLESEKALVSQALQLDYVSLRQLLRTGVLAEARRALTFAEKLDTIDLADNAARGRMRGSGYMRVQQCVADLMAQNEAATSLQGRRYISRGQVFRLSGVNRQDINGFFETNAATLQAHHEAMGFASPAAGEAHNRRLAAGDNHWTRRLKAKENGVEEVEAENHG
jgi:hypothetical protein